MIDAYRENGRIHQPDEPRAALVEDWWAARQAGAAALMVAPRLRDVDDLNRRARRLLLDQGALREQVVIGVRAFAVGDEVLALRNDYRLQILNGTTGTITAIDEQHRLLRLGCDGRALTLPFRYAEGGDLTHGYASTLHKAQGATVDRCFVLADETFAREHLYTAMSRGTERNDLYLADLDDGREEVRNAPKVDGRTDTLRHVATRSSAQRLAIDLSDDALTPRLALEAERRRLVGLLSLGPPDPSVELRHVQDDIDRARESRDDAVRRHELASTGLNELGPIGRHVHRARRAQLTSNLDNASRDLGRHDARLAELSTRANELTAAMPARRAWERQHEPEFDRLDALQKTIRARELARTIERAKVVEHEIDHGISL